MKIRITDWRCENLRIGKGIESIELGNPPARWSLIQMPNGAGKTSTMTLIRAVLGGEKLSPESVRGFRASDTVEAGVFELGLLIDGRHQDAPKRYRLTADFDFNDGSYRYSTLRAEPRGGGREPGLLLPSDLKHILRSEFIKLFVFDGELARDIRDLGKAAADRAIRTLYQLDDIATLRQRVGKAVKERQDLLARTSAKTKQAVSRHRTLVARATTVLRSLESALTDKASSHAALRKELKDVRTKIDSHIARNGDLEERRSQLVSQAHDLAGDIRMSTSQAFLAFRNPAILSSVIRSRLKDLGETLTRARLPKSVSSDFFEEIADDGECICGRPIGDTERAALSQRKEQYLAQDQISAIATMKERLNSTAATGTSFLDSCDILQTKLETLQANEKAMARLRQEAEERGDEDMRPLTERENAIKFELATLEAEIERLKTGDAVTQGAHQCTKENNIPLARQYRDERQKILDEVLESYELSCRRDLLLDQLQRIEQTALEDLREVIRQETNKRLTTLVPLEDLRVAKIAGALELGSKKASTKDDVSEGQSLAVAYAFLTALLSNAPYDLPFIVDSPVVSLDLDVRKEVSRLIPKLFGQMILFVISSEQAAFAETFYEREDTRFVTLRQTANGHVETHYGLEEFRRHSTDRVNT